MDPEDLLDVPGAMEQARSLLRMAPQTQGYVRVDFESAILAGVAARAVAGNASNPAMARKYGAAVPALAAMATIVINEGAEL